MKRKIIKQGISTLTLSLPAKWANRYNLKAGDEVDVEEREKSLVVSTQKGFATKRRSEINLEKATPFFVRTCINAVYIRGDDEVKVTFEDPKTFDQVQESINNLTIGFEVIERCSKYCIIKDLSGVTDTSFESILSRIFLLTISFAEDGFEAIKKGQYKLAYQMRTRDLNINKFVNYCLRTLNKKGHPEFHKTIHYYTIINLLENLADEYARLFTHLKGPLKKTTIESFGQVIELYREFHKLFYKFDRDFAIKIVEKRTKLRDELSKRMATTSIEDTKVLFRLTKISELITDIIKMQLAIFI